MGRVYFYPVGGGTDFLKFYDEAKALSKLKADALNASNIASMFSRKSDVMPNELAEKFWKGEFTSCDWDYFVKLSKALRSPASGTIFSHSLLSASIMVLMRCCVSLGF